MDKNTIKKEFDKAMRSEECKEREENGFLSEFMIHTREELAIKYKLSKVEELDLQKWMEKKIKKRLEYFRKEIRAERISYSEIAELQSLTDHIDKGDVELLEWAGVKEK